MTVLYYAINKMNSVPKCSLFVEMHSDKHQVQLKTHQLKNNEHLNGPYEIRAPRTENCSPYILVNHNQ